MKAAAVISLPIAIMLSLGATNCAMAEQGKHMLSRYTSINTAPSRDQSNPLLTVVSFAFPPSVKTVGQAINYTLEQTGYSLVDASDMPEQAKIMMTLPLPNVQRKFQYVEVKSALASLAGDAFRMLVDPIRRQITFVPVFQSGESYEAKN